MVPLLPFGWLGRIEVNCGLFLLDRDLSKSPIDRWENHCYTGTTIQGALAHAG